MPELDLTMGAEAWVVKYADSSNAFGIQFIPTMPGPAQERALAAVSPVLRPSPPPATAAIIAGSRRLEPPHQPPFPSHKRRR